MKSHYGFQKNDRDVMSNFKEKLLKIEIYIRKRNFALCHLTGYILLGRGYLTLCCVGSQNYLAIEDLNDMSLKEAWASLKFQ